MSYVGNGGLHKAPTKEERKGRLRGEGGLLLLDLKDEKLQDSGKQEEGKTFHKLLVLGINYDLRGRPRGLGSENWKGCICILW